MKQNKKILVTGGAGFLGSHLCEALLAQNQKVICLDNFYTGRKENIEPLLKNPDFELISQDVCTSISLKVDEIYHLACPASPIHYQHDPIKTLKTNFMGTLHLLELSQDLGIPILFTSTSEVYGDPHVHPQSEDYWGHVNPIGIRSCYDEGKRVAETLCTDFHKQWGTNVKIARIFNTYGPHMCPKDGRVISNFIMQALEQQTITVYGDGTQTRSFCYVDDNINALMKLMQSQDIHQPINIGNPTEYTVKQIAELILTLTQSQSKVTYHPLPHDDPKQRKPDISLAKSLLGWEPKIDLMVGLQKTIDYFKDVIHKKYSRERIEL